MHFFTLIAIIEWTGKHFKKTLTRTTSHDKTFSSLSRQVNKFFCFCCWNFALLNSTWHDFFSIFFQLFYDIYHWVRAKKWLKCWNRFVKGTTVHCTSALITDDCIKEQLRRLDPGGIGGKLFIDLKKVFLVHFSIITAEIIFPAAVSFDADSIMKILWSVECFLSEIFSLRLHNFFIVPHLIFKKLR